MSKPIFSLIAPAIRSKFYERVYNSISFENDIPFEIIFVGHKNPDKKMPQNFHYVYTKVKPAQSLEIAARNASGDYLIPVSDDLLFSEGFLKNTLKYIEEKGKDVFITYRLAINGEMKDDWIHLLSVDKKIEYTPLGATGVFDRKIWHKLGGIDKGFYYAFSDSDLQLRFRETRDIFITPDCWINESRDAHKGSRRASKIISMKSERIFFNKFWVKNNKFVGKRLEKVIPFDDKDILIKNQGRNAKGGWD
jgi:GT2 family glycosyltransferase